AKEPRRSLDDPLAILPRLFPGYFHGLASLANNLLDTIYYVHHIINNDGRNVKRKARYAMSSQVEATVPVRDAASAQHEPANPRTTRLLKGPIVPTLLKLAAPNLVQL